MQKRGNTKTHSKSMDGDKITVGNVTKSTGVAIGRGAKATVTQTTGASASEIAKAFAALNAKVDALPEGPDKEIAKNAAQGLEGEAKKGTQASEANITKWFNFLAQSSSDAFDVAVTTFSNPIAGLSLAFKKIAERAKAERQTKK